MPNVLITGITGFVGSHLSDYILANHPEYKVHGLTRWRSPKENISHIVNKIHLHHGDLIDHVSLVKILKKVKPKFIFHLAAQSFVPFSFDAPIATLQANCIGTCNLLEAIKEVREIDETFDPVVHACSSSETYGQVTEDDIPIKEDCPFRPASPYAVSKVCEDMLALQYWLSWKIKTIRTRMFTHSVGYDSPLIIRDRMHLIDILPISDIRKARKKVSQEVWDFDDRDMEIWNGVEFTKILNISAHKLNGHRLLKTVTSGGICDVTDNHSIFDAEDNLVNAGDLKVGDKISIQSIPINNGKISSVSTKLAWLLGFLCAEGTIKNNRRIVFSNNDIQIINKCKSYILECWGKESSIDDSRKCIQLNVLNGSEIAHLLNDHNSVFAIYTRCRSRFNKRYKRVPKIILNSSTEIQISFLEGFNDGDGRKNANLKSLFQEFKNVSPVLSCGLIYLIKNTTNQEFVLNCEPRNLSGGITAYYYSINLRSNSGDPRQNTGQHLLKERNVIKKIMTVSEDRNEFVYDIETESHTFSCGIGSTKVHNSGPRRGEFFVLSNFCQQVSKIEKGLQNKKLFVGNIDSVRTFADVRDTVKAYWLLVNKCDPGDVYNIGGNRTMTIREMIDVLFSMSTVKGIEIVVDSSRLRPSDVTLQIPCIDKFVNKTGWKPEIPFETTVKDTLDFWRQRV